MAVDWNDPNSDPYTAVGGGTYVSGSWYPSSHPLAQHVGTTTTPTTTTAPPQQTTQQFAGVPAGQDPFAASGGGVYVNGSWVPSSHPLAQQGGTTAPASGAGATPASGTPGSQQSGYYGGSQTGPQPYNATPAAQTTFMDQVARQMQQGLTVDPNDPVLRAQSDAYAANIERQRRNAVADNVERVGPYATGAMQGFDLMSRERAGQATGQFEADLVGRELQNRRDEIQRALQMMQGVLSEDQRAALERERMALDAELQRLGITTAASTAANELGVREMLGIGGLNVDMMRALLQNQQFGDSLGLQTAQAEFDAMRDLF